MCAALPVPGRDFAQNKQLNAGGRIIGSMTRRAPFLAAFLLCSLPLLAAPDLHLVLTAPQTARQGETFTMSASIENAGDTSATGVRLMLAAYPFRICSDNADIGDIAPRERREVTCSFEIPLEVDRYQFHASAAVYSADELPETGGDNASSFEVEIVTSLPDLTIFDYGIPHFVRQGRAMLIRIGYRNKSRRPSSGATIVITVPRSFGALPPNCTASGSRAECVVGAIDPPHPYLWQPHILELEAIAPDASEHAFDISLEIRAHEGDHRPADDVAVARVQTYRSFFVTESSELALRAAIEAANARCTDGHPCLIALDRVSRIDVTAPLPWITATPVFVQGDQKVTIVGAPGSVSGIELASCDAELRDLTLIGFPGNAVTIAGSAGCTTNFARRATGLTIRDSGRGIVVNTPWRWVIEHNDIRNCARSGVFIENGQCKVRNNTITHNGASGVYVGAGGSGTDVDDNHLSFNTHFGVGLGQGAYAVAMKGNSFHANGQQAIDWGLNGHDAGAPLPEITSVRYEDGVTVIEGTAPNAWGTINLYANDAPDPSGFGEGQYTLGAYPRDGARFTIRHPGDLRGKWVAVTMTTRLVYGWIRPMDKEYWYTTETSEFSRAVEVKE
jgi:hypothetical protein